MKDEDAAASRLHPSAFILHPFPAALTLALGGQTCLLLVCPVAGECGGIVAWWGRHSCLSIARECGGILAPAERATMSGTVFRIRAGSGARNGRTRRRGADRNVCPTAETGMSAPPLKQECLPHR